jgi:hypothetical protein
MIGIGLILFSALVCGYVVACEVEPRSNRPLIYMKHAPLLRTLAFLPFLVVLVSSVRYGLANLLTAILIYSFISYVCYYLLKRYGVTPPKQN